MPKRKIEKGTFIEGAVGPNGKPIKYKSAFANAPRTRLFKKGIPLTLERWMLEHPGERIPRKEFAKKFGCASATIQKIVKKIELFHKLPPRKRGGPNFRISPEAEKIIQIELNHAKNKKQDLDAWDIIQKVARETKEVVNSDTIIKKGKVIGVRVKSTGVARMNTIQIRDKLKQEGIEITKIRIYSNTSRR